MFLSKFFPRSMTLEVALFEPNCFLMKFMMGFTSKWLQEKISKNTYLCSGKVCTLIWDSAIITNPDMPGMPANLSFHSTT